MAGQPVASEAVVHKFAAAFNNHDVAAMTAFVADDAQWLSVEGAKLSVETSGKSALAIMSLAI